MTGLFALVASAFTVIGAAPSVVQAAPFVPVAAVPLGLASTFGALTPAAFTSTAATTFRGDVGAATYAFDPAGTHTGAIYLGPDAAPMLADVAAAYTNAKERPAGTPLLADMGGTTAGPGVHTNAIAGGMAAGGTFTIDGQNQSDAVFIFQINGALALAATTHIVLINGAQAKNVYWQVNGAGSVGAGSTFVGTMIANAAISSGAANLINGRLLTTSGAISMAGNDVYSSPPSVAINGGVAASTTSTSPAVSGVTSVRSPSTVTVRIDGVAEAFHPVPSSTGTWTLTPANLLINGNHVVVASVQDGAGNIGTFTQTLTVDTILPVVTIDGDPTAATNDLSPTITGTTDIAAGQPVTITMTRTTPSLTLTRTTVVQSDQTWNISPNGFSAGEWTVEARVIDPAGNPNSATQVLTVDATAPAATITSSALTNDPTPTIFGTTEIGASVTVSVDGVALTDVIVAGGTWTASTTVVLGHGTHNVSVMATDAVGNSTSPAITQSLMVDLILPIIAINPGATDATNDRTPTIVGTTDVAPGAGVIVSVSIDGGAALTALVQSDGWNVTPSVPVAVGARTLVATVADPAGNVGSFTQVLTIDIAAPGVDIDGGPARTTTDATPTISGSSSDVAVGSPVTVTINDQILSTTINVGGTFSVTAATIPNGTHFAFVTVTDAAGNSGNDNQALTVNAIAPTVAYTNGPSASTNDATPLISGTTNAAVGSAVEVSAAGQTLYATVQPGGSWNVTSAHFDNGDVTIVTRITDASGNVGSATQILTIDSTTPTTIVILGGSAAAINDDTPMISGTTDAADGRVITVTIAAQTMTVSAAAGTWAVTATQLTDGTYGVTATVSHVGGNPGSATQLLTIDTVAPVVVIGGGGGTVQTTDPTPAITGGGATPGSTVIVTVAGQTMTTTVAADGTWSVTPPNPLPGGANAVTVTITDPAGNTGTGTQTITVVSEATTITFNGAASAATNDDTPTISGSTNSADGRILTVTISTQTMTTTISGGLWAVDTTHLADGTYNVTATVSVADGTPAASSQSLTIDTIGPGIVTPPPATNPPATDPSAPTPPVTNPLTTDMTSVGPKRVFDTRPGESPNALRSVVEQQVGGPRELKVQMTDLAGFVPATGVGAVSLNVTSTGSTTDGFITVYTCGTRELVSSVNFAAGRTVANAVVTPVSATGAVCFYASSPTDIIVDINAWFATGEAFTAVGPKRVFDTRAGESPDALRSVTKSKIPAGGLIEVRITDIAGLVPADGVGSVSLNVVVTNPEAAGFVTVYSCGTRALVSSVNFLAGKTVANAVIAPVSPSGTVCFYSLAATDLVVDINGWLSAGSSFTGVNPARILDTRPGESPDALRSVAKAKIGGSNVLEVNVTGIAGVVPPTGVTAVSLNVTAVDPTADGFITVFACGAREEVSSLNYAALANVANAVLAPVSPTGTICLYSSAPTDVIVDINGWIGAPQAG